MHSPARNIQTRRIRCPRRLWHVRGSIQESLVEPRTRQNLTKQNRMSEDLGHYHHAACHHERVADSRIRLYGEGLRWFSDPFPQLSNGNYSRRETRGAIVQYSASSIYVRLAMLRVPSTVAEAPRSLPTLILQKANNDKTNTTEQLLKGHSISGHYRAA
jgi:hypothetical protein